MRGKSLKKIKKFVDELIANTPPEQIVKTREQMIEEVKVFWKKSGEAKEFVDLIVSGKDTLTYSVEKK